MQGYNPHIPAPADIPISVFQSVSQQCAFDYTLQQFIDITIGRTPNRYASAIAYLRTLDKAADKVQYDRTKKGLCAFTLSCRCTPGQGRTKHPEQNNGVLCIDIDSQDNPHLHDWEKVRDALGTLKYCYFAALSAGGKGVFVIMAVDPRTPHEDSFEAAQSFFQNQLGIVIDKSCRDIARLRYISHDPAAVVKQPTEIFRVLLAKTSPAAPARREMTSRDNNDRVRAAVNCWIRHRIPIDDYDDWRDVAASLKSLPDAGELFDAVSQFGKHYRGSSDTAKKLEQVQNLRRVGIGTFFHICNRYGISNAEINEELSSMRRSSDEQKTRQKAAETPPADTAASTPIGPGETQEQARERNERMMNECLFAIDLLKEVGRFRPPTYREIEIMNPAIAPPQFAPF